MCVRTHLLPFLEVTNMVDDNRLIQELHKVVAESVKRRKKIQSKTLGSSAKGSVVESNPELSAVLKKLEENSS